jgi:hypothetical protein
MAQTAKCENERESVSDNCWSHINDGDINLPNVSSFLPATEKVTKPTGRKSFYERRSSCFETLGAYFSYLIKRHCVECNATS